MNLKYFSALVIGVFFCLTFCTTREKHNNLVKHLGIEKIKDVVIYEDSQFYSSFPSVVKNGKNDFIVAFRRAPDRRIFNEKGNNLLADHRIPVY